MCNYNHTSDLFQNYINMSHCGKIVLMLVGRSTLKFSVINLPADRNCFIVACPVNHIVSTREEKLQRILSNARGIKNAAVLHKVASSLVTLVQKMYPRGGRALRTNCLSAQRRICDCTLNNISQ